jgi:hypothetical protein
MNGIHLNIPFAVMVDGRSLKKWQADSIRILNNSGICQCVVFISNPEKPANRKNIIAKIFSRNAFYHFLLNRIFRVREEDITSLPDHIPVIEVCPEEKGCSQYFSDSDIKVIIKYKPAFILRFGYNILRGSILNAAPFGIWSFHHGDERRFRGGPFGFHEIKTKTPVTGVILQKLTSKLDAGHVLIRREYITVMHSWKEMRQRLLAENTDMPLLAVKKYIIQKEIIPESSETKASIFKAPGFSEMSQFLLMLWLQRVIFHINRLFVYESWHIESGFTNKSPFDPIIPADTKVSPVLKNEFFADPFILQTADNSVILAEHFSYKHQIGSIVASIPNNESKTLLKANTHLAYPFVFNISGKNWVIPENANSDKCIAYLIDNQLNVVDQVVLLELPAVDPTLIFHEGKYYLFCGLKNQLPNEKLFIFWSDAFEGPYQPHYLNPVKVTPIGSRSGGSMLKWQNFLFRPAQVFDIFYGKKVLIFNVKELSPQLFVEEEYAEIAPAIFGKKYCGLHTYSVLDNRYSVDLKFNQKGISAFIFRWQQNRRSRMNRRATDAK